MRLTPTSQQRSEREIPESTIRRPHLLYSHQALEGWPEKGKVQPYLKPYWNAQGELTVDGNDLLLYSKRIVVPKVLQRRTLEKIHEGHQGIQRSRLRAMTSVWWPAINHEMQNLVKQFPTCSSQRADDPHTIA